MTPLGVRTAGPADEQALKDVLLMAFVDDPVSRWVWPKPADFLAGLPVLQWALGGKGLDHGTAWLTADGAGAALWLPPNAEPDFAPVGPMMEQTVTPEHMAGVGALMAQVQAAHPAFPHWYLAVLGVDPHRQSEGLGAQLMKAALARVDAEGLPAYLESSNQRNVPFYERHGFEVIGRIQAGSSPVITPMLRPAR